jgi:hypothetical protein
MQPPALTDVQIEMRIGDKVDWVKAVSCTAFVASCPHIPDLAVIGTAISYHMVVRGRDGLRY